MKKFLHIFIFTILSIALFCVFASAASWQDADGITWSFTYSDTDMTATITSGTTPKSGTDRTHALNIPAKVRYNSKEYTVTKIGNNAFDCGDNFTTSNALSKKYFGHVTIPDTVVEIGEYAFDSSAIFGEIVIPESVTKIGKYAFRNCVGLDTVVFPSSFDTVPEGCFQGCKALVEFKTEGLIKSFKANAFRDCQSLYSITISKEVVEIANNAFSNCYCLAGELNFPVITTLGGSAFSNCYFITGVTIGGNCNFSSDAFGGCSDFKYYNVAEENTYYKSIDGVLFSKDMKTLYRYPLGKVDSEFVIPESVTTVKGSAFYGAKNLTNIVIGSNVTKIEGSAFRNTGITTLYIPNNVTSLGDNVASGCTSLVWVVFGKGITSFRSDFVTVGSNYAIKYIFSTLTGGGTGSLPGSGETVLTYYMADRSCEDYYGGHKYGYLDDPATCDEDGTNICCFCGKSSVAPATGHRGKILRSTKLTCTTPEAYYIDCVNCSTPEHPEAEVIVTPSTGHTLSVTTSKVASTYEYAYRGCTTCGEIVVDSFETNAYVSADVNGDGNVDAKDVALLGKILSGSASSANRFACDVDGDGSITAFDLLLLKQYVAEFAVAIDKNENTCDNHVRINTVILTYESCIYGGKSISFCADCGEEIKELEKTTAPTGHLFVETIIEAATCKKEGKSSKTCSVCRITEDNVTIPVLPHDTQSWWMLSDNEPEYQYSYCTVCKALQHEAVDRAILQEVVTTIPENYNLYCTTESASLLRPIVENASKALTQEQVDTLVEEIRRVLPTIQYKVSDIPVIYLESPDKLSKTEYSSANIIVAYKDENGDLQTLSDAEGEMRIRGNYTSGFSAKLPFNIKFSRKVDLFGMGAGRKYHLLACAYDQPLIRTALAFEFAKDLGLDYTCKYQFVEVYHNGIYRGCYMLITPIDIGEGRVDIDEEKDVIIHLSYSNGGEDAPYNSPIFGFSYIRLEEPSEYSPFTRAQMMRIMYQLDFAILSGDTDEMAKYMDVESMVNFFVFHEFVKDTDIVWDSTRFYIEDGKLHGGPAWDLDISQGNVGKGGGNLNSNSYMWIDVNGDGTLEFNYEGSGVTDAQFKALKDQGLYEYRSAYGTWASTDWAKHFRKNNNTSDAFCFRWWYYYLEEYSEEFMNEVAKCISENEDIIASYYTDSIDPDTDAPIRCLIDELAYGEAGEAITRNYLEASRSPIYSSRSLPDSVDYLRTWWKLRSEWLFDYYSTQYPEAYNK